MITMKAKWTPEIGAEMSGRGYGHRYRDDNGFWYYDESEVLIEGKKYPVFDNRPKRWDVFDSRPKRWDVYDIVASQLAGQIQEEIDNEILADLAVQVKEMT